LLVGIQLKAEAYESLICYLQDIVVLFGLGLNILFGSCWADPITAMLLIPFLMREGLDSFREEQEAQTNHKIQFFAQFRYVFIK